MAGPIIQTPRGAISLNKNGKAELKWNTNFTAKHQKSFTSGQKYVDSEVLRLSEKYTPLLTGTLIKSGILGTEIGSGTVSWIAPYSRYQYYLRRKTESKTGALRGPYWFHRMKEVHGKEIIRVAKAMAAGAK